MENYIRYEDMPSSAQNDYDRNNKARRSAMFVGGIGFIITFISGCLSEVNDILMYVMLIAVYISAIPGVVHANLRFRKLRSAGLIGLAIWFLATLFVGICGSLIFLVMDIVRYTQKKPLILTAEHKFFAETPAAQQEMEAMTIAEFLRQNDASTAAANLRQLKEMYDSGILTEDEFNAKKAELLERM